MGVTLTGIDPKTEARVSKIATQMREGELGDLAKASNGIVVGDGIAQRLAIKTGNTVLLAAGDIQISATVVGIFRTGMKQVDESNVYSLARVAQVLVGQSGLVNQLKLRLRDPLLAQQVAIQVETQVGYKTVSWQEANADLLGTFAVRDFIMLTVMAAMLLVSSFATYNIISTITYEKRHDIAIMKSLGMREYLVRRIFVMEAAMIGAVGIVLGWILGFCLCYGLGKITVYNPISGATVPLEMYYSTMQYAVSGGISMICCAGAAFFPAQKGNARSSGRDYPGGFVSEAPIALQTVGLVKRVEGAISHTLVNGIDLAVTKGEFLAITGPSGSGKSSLLYLLGLLDAPTEGEVIVCGQETSKLSETERADVRLTKCGFVFQFHFLLPEFTALENVLLPLRTAGKLSSGEMNERATGLLESLGLGLQMKKRPNQLSGGQRQRVALARALANRPEIIVADEPTGNLDVASTEQVFGLLREIANGGQTVVVVTHDAGLAARADRRIHIVDGKISETTFRDQHASKGEAASADRKEKSPLEAPGLAETSVEPTPAPGAQPQGNAAE